METTPLFYEDIRLDLRLESPGRTVTESDVVQFATLTGDFNEIHTNHQAARQSVFGAPVAHGLLGLAYVAGLSARLPGPPIAIKALLAVREWNFRAPIFFGDTIRLVASVESKRPTKSGASGVVHVKREVVNQDNTVVQDGVIVLLVATRPEPVCA